MRFPEQPREGTPAHDDAIRRLADARDHQHHMSDELDGSKATASERSATANLAAANETLAAREAWVSWVERGY